MMSEAGWWRGSRLALFAVIAVAALSQVEVALADAPKVIKASPDNGQEQVDPRTTQIRIEFDQPMNTNGYSIVGGGEQFPTMVGKPLWQGDRAIVISVKLEPDHDYSLSINSTTFTNFRGRNGESAEPYPIAFRTAAASPSGQVQAAPTRLREENQRAFGELRRAMLEDYSYRDRMNIDWAKVLDGSRSQLEEAATPAEFARRAAKLLEPAQDMHLSLKVDGGTVSTTSRSVSRNYNRATLGRIVPGWTQRAEGVFTGRYPDGIGYIYIGSWSHNRPENVRAAVSFVGQLHEAPGLIIDVRANGGGQEGMARELAGCFIDRPVAYAKDRTMAGGQLSKIHERVLEPSSNGTRFRGKVVVLMGQANMSTCESFLMMMQQVPGCLLIGDRSWGSSGNPHEINLGNGVSLHVPTWQALKMDGSILEGKGIEPDIRIPADRGSGVSDPVLEAALKELRGAKTRR